MHSGRWWHKLNLNLIWQVVADDRSGLVSSSDLRPVALRIVSEGGRSTVLSTPPAPLPMRQGVLERTMLAIDWQRAAHRCGCSWAHTFCQACCKSNTARVHQMVREEQWSVTMVPHDRVCDSPECCVA